MKITFYTLGCKVNQFETQAMELCFAERGYEIVSFHEDSDIYVINTCSVTAVSDKKSRQMIRKTARMHPDALIAVCGCFVQTNPEAAQNLPGVDVVSGTGDKAGFIDMIETALREKRTQFQVDHALSRRTFEELPAGGLFGHTRAMLKVQDGCVNFCTYCIIPYARGPVRSMPIEHAVAEAIRLSNAGYREIVITGIEISSYGVDLQPKLTLGELIERICHAVPDVRVRLGSLEPRTVDEAFIKTLKPLKNLCPQFHLSLQSGCDATLKRMHRKYDTARYLTSVFMLRDAFPKCAITTDLIVGFPGEDENEFKETLVFIEKCAFSSMHIFPYSKRANTPAATMSNQVLNSVKEVRAGVAAQIAANMKEVYLRSCVGQVHEVLFEECVDGLWKGHSENYVLCCVHAGSNLHNLVRHVRIESVENGYLLGTIEDF